MKEIPMHPEAIAASECIANSRLLALINTLGSDREKVLRLAQMLKETGFRVVEVLDRDPDGLALDVIGDIRDMELYPILGTAMRTDHIREAIEKGAVGMVSPANKESLIRAAIEQKGGARIAVPTVETTGEYHNALSDKIEAVNVSHASELHPALQMAKFCPAVEAHHFGPDPTNPKKANVYTERMLGITAASTASNCRPVVTGLKSPEEARPFLEMNMVGGVPLHTVVGTSFDSRDKVDRWLDGLKGLVQVQK